MTPAIGSPVHLRHLLGWTRRSRNMETQGTLRLLGCACDLIRGCAHARAPKSMRQLVTVPLTRREHNFGTVLILIIMCLSIPATLAWNSTDSVRISVSLWVVPPQRERAGYCQSHRAGLLGSSPVLAPVVPMWLPVAGCQCFERIHKNHLSWHLL